MSQASSPAQGQFQYDQGLSHPQAQYGQAPHSVQPQLLYQQHDAPFADPSSSSAEVPAGQMSHAPSSHFVSSGSFDFGGRLDEGLGALDTAGLLPNLGSQPLEMTEMELESTPESDFTSPREYGAATHGPAGPAGKNLSPSVMYLSAVPHEFPSNMWYMRIAVCRVINLTFSPGYRRLHGLA